MMEFLKSRMPFLRPDKPYSEETVLLLGNYRPTVILARVLSKKGFTVISGREGCDGGAQYCRYVNELWDHPPVRKDAECLSALRDFLANRPEITVVYPVSEEFVRLLADNHETLPAGPSYAMVKPETVAQCLDKTGMMNLAVSCGVPTAPFEIAGGKKSFAEAVGRIGFPLVVRPEKSTDRIDGKKAVHFDGQADIADFCRSALQAGQRLLLQRKAEGRRHNLYFGAVNGKLVRYLHALILRTDMLDGTGLAVEGVTIEPDPKLRDYTERLVSALGYTGVGCAQFLVDEVTGSISFLEINPRIAGNHAVPEAAGLELSTLPIDLCRNADLDLPKIEGKAHLRYVWTCGDLLGAKLAYLRGDIAAWTMLNWVAHTISIAIRAHVHMKLCWHDPMPALVPLAALAPSMAGITRSLRDLTPSKNVARFLRRTEAQ